MSAAGRITYRTSSYGFGDRATDEDRDSFCAFVERRVEETYPGYTCVAQWGGGALESYVTVDSDAEDAPEASELRSWIGNELWDEWCSSQQAAAS